MENKPQINWKERRKYFRLTYPDVERPLVTLTSGSFKVTEISEGGLKLFARVTQTFRIGEEVRGKIKFRDGSIVEIQGKILRKLSTEIIVQLSKLIPGWIVIAEQRYLIKNYPKLKHLWT